MQTELAAFIRDTPEGREADAILRKCVHCGFCTATCPTYQLLGDELDGPRPPAPAPRSLPDLPRMRDHLPLGRAVRAPRRYRPRHRRGARATLALAARQTRRARVRAAAGLAVRRGAAGRPDVPFPVAGPGAGAGGARGGLARAAPCAPHARAFRLRAAGACAAHQRGGGTRAGPVRRVADRRRTRAAAGRCVSTSTTRRRAVATCAR